MAVPFGDPEVWQRKVCVCVCSVILSLQVLLVLNLHKLGFYLSPLSLTTQT